MAKIQELYDRDTQETIYPKTVTRAVYCADGANLDSQLTQMKEQTVDIAARMGNVRAETPVSEETLPDFSTLTREELSMDSFISKWQAACAYYETTFKVVVGGYYPALKKPFVLNEVEMSYQEALLVYELSFANAIRLPTAVNTSSSPTLYQSGACLYYNTATLRTVFPPVVRRSGGVGLSCNCMFRLSDIEVFVAISFTDYLEYGHLFSQCRYLHTVKFTKSVVLRPFTNTFAGCVRLVTVEIANLRENVSFADSPLLSRESIAYMAANRVYPDKAFIMTVHPDVYAKLTGDTTNAAAAALTPGELAEWQQVLADAAEKNITFTIP